MNLRVVLRVDKAGIELTGTYGPWYGCITPLKTTLVYVVLSEHAGIENDSQEKAGNENVDMYNADTAGT